MKQINLTGGWEKLYKKEDQKLEKKSQQYYLYSERRSCFSFFVKTKIFLCFSFFDWWLGYICLELIFSIEV
jgi:hypothetical protein